MKKLSELGISPAPWTVEHDEHEPFAIMSALGIVCDTYYNEPAKHTVPDARLIAASPKLYAKAYEVAENLLVHLAVPTQTISMNRAEVAAMVKDLQSALAEAAGEEVAE